MSVYSIQHPDIPVSIPDELESFLHVLLYLALRCLRSSLKTPGNFIHRYFMSSETDDDGRTLCAELKQQVVSNGELVFNRKPVSFLSAPQPSSESQKDGPPAADSPPPSRLNPLIEDLLSHFKAHYIVREYNAAVKLAAKAHPEHAQPPVKPLPSLYDSMKSAAPTNNGRGNRLLKMRQKFGDAQTPAMATPQVIEARSAKTAEVRKPSEEEKQRAARLTTHKYVRDLFYGYLQDTVPWPSDDHVGDQLQGYVHAEQTSKRPRLDSGTMATILEAGDVQPSSSA